MYRKSSRRIDHTMARYEEGRWRFVMVKIVPYVSDMEEYLKADDVIDHRKKPIMQLADELFQ